VKIVSYAKRVTVPFVSAIHEDRLRRKPINYPPKHERSDQSFRPSIRAPSRRWYPRPLHDRHAPKAPLKSVEWLSFERLHALHAR